MAHLAWDVVRKKTMDQHSSEKSRRVGSAHRALFELEMKSLRVEVTAFRYRFGGQCPPYNWLNHLQYCCSCSLYLINSRYLIMQSTEINTAMILIPHSAFVRCQNLKQTLIPKSNAVVSQMIHIPSAATSSPSVSQSSIKSSYSLKGVFAANHHHSSQSSRTMRINN